MQVLPTQQIALHPKPVEVPVAKPDALPFPKSIVPPAGQLAAMASDADEDEGLKHFEQVGNLTVLLFTDAALSIDGFLLFFFIYRITKFSTVIFAQDR